MHRVISSVGWAWVPHGRRDDSQLSRNLAANWGRERAERGPLEVAELECVLVCSCARVLVLLCVCGMVDRV